MKRPKFWGKTKTFCSFISSIGITYFTAIKLPEEFSNKKIILCVSSIFIFCFIVSAIICNIIYAFRLYFYCNNLEKNIIGITEAKKTLVKDIKKIKSKNKALEDYNNKIYNTLIDVVSHLETGMLNKSKEEQKYLEKLHDIVTKKLNNLKQRKDDDI